MQIPGEFSPAAWFDAWPTGRSFVTNGPVLTFTVNGNRDGNQIEIAHGEGVEINATARVNPDLDEIGTLELVVHGEVIAASSARGAYGIQLQHTLQPESSTWFSLRTNGKRGTVAHTAPVYILVNGDQRFWKRDAVEKISRHYIKALETLRDSRPEPHDDFELFNTQKHILSKWDAVKSSQLHPGERRPTFLETGCS